MKTFYPTFLGIPCIGMTILFSSVGKGFTENLPKRFVLQYWIGQNLSKIHQTS